MLRAAQTLLRIAAALILIGLGLPVVAVLAIAISTIFAGLGLGIGAVIALVLLLAGILAIANALDRNSLAELTRTMRRGRPDLRTVPKDPAA